VESAFSPKVIENANRTANYPLKVLRFVNSPSSGRNGLTTEIISFRVRGYYPTFSHYWTSHYDDKFESHGPMNMWLCPCQDCDSSFITRTTSTCSLGPSVGDATFHRHLIWADGVLHSKQLTVFYVHDSPLNLGYSTTILADGTELKHPINITTDLPRCVRDLHIGSQSKNATDAEGRPLFPAAFITEFQAGKDNRRGDWQHGGLAIPPNEICGIWGTSTKRITPTGFEDQVDASNASMNLEGSGSRVCRYDTTWDYGAGAPSLPWNWETKQVLGLWFPIWCCPHLELELDEVEARIILSHSIHGPFHHPKQPIQL